MRLSALGLIGGAFLASAVSVAPVSAQSASISGSVTFITPAGFTSTISAESVLPPGFVFQTGTGVLTVPAVPNANATVSNAQVIAVPSYNVLGFSVAATTLSVASTAAPTAVTGGASFTAAAATILTNAAAATIVGTNPAQVLDGLGNVVYSSSNIDFIAAIISAGAGVSGLD